MITWILLTRGDRNEQLDAAVDSIRCQTIASRIIVIVNGADAPPASAWFDKANQVVCLPENIGVPGGRDRGAREATTDIVAFLDDDAVLMTPDANERIECAFADNVRCGAISFRIEDESGEVQRRHVPRLGARRPDVGGPVATFLGGGSAVRRCAYDLAGGYWGDLFYAHEELDLSWRLHEADFDVQYRPDILVRHPRTTVGRHSHGWFMTGRNRVRVARRNLPAVVALVHATVWLLLGSFRAHEPGCRRGYWSGWLAGWRDPVQRRPVRWRTIARLTRAGRPPII